MNQQEFVTMPNDPCSEFLPLYDPFESPHVETIFDFHDNPNPTIDDLDLFSGQQFDPPLSPQLGCDAIGDHVDPLSDPFILDLLNEPSIKCPEIIGPLGETSNVEPSSFQFKHQGLGCRNSSEMMPDWGVQDVPVTTCYFCEVLRILSHTNGNHTVKLEIHGRFGIVSHAILEDEQSLCEVPPMQKHQMFDFSKKTIEEVKQFLEQYCHQREQAGYMMLEDPLSNFYETLCVGLNWDDNCLNFVDFCEEFPPTGIPMVQTTAVLNNQGENGRKTPLATQRERTGKMNLEDFVKYFHLPIEAAAKEMNVCLTVVKKICRKGGLLRWPHRKIKSLEKKISTLKNSLPAVDDQEKGRIQSEIDRLHQEINSICAKAISRR